LGVYRDGIGDNIAFSCAASTGTINPFGPDTAIEISQNRKQSCDHHPSYYLHLGIIATLVTAFVKNDMYPKPIHHVLL
jgi:hypothetical protein